MPASVSDFNYASENTHNTDLVGNECYHETIPWRLIHLSATASLGFLMFD